MKKFLFALAALAISASASAQSAEELRIYINPGHGSWTGGDRNMNLVTHGTGDTLGFYESNTNLRKGFGVLESLRTYGLKYDPTLNQEGERWQIGAARDLTNNIVMSHVKCGPGFDEVAADGTDLSEVYNRSLTEISQEVDANNFDMFISIHSNAASEGTNTNFPLFLYRGYDDKHEEDGVTALHQETSYAMADACWEYWFENPHMSWTNYSMTSQNIRGDINFMGSSYWTTTDKGSAKGYYGVLRHLTPGFLVEGYFHTYQPGRHKAMNFDADFLEGVCYAHGIADYFGLTKESTGNIYGVVRDKYEVFSHDYYKPNISTDDKYLPLNGVKVILKKDGAEVATYTTDGFYNGVFVFKNVEPGTYTIAFEHESYLPLEEELTVEVKAAGIAYPTAFLQNVAWTPPAIVYEDYPDVLNGLVDPAGAYSLNPLYVDTEIAELAGKTIRRTIFRGENLYILAVDENNAPTVLIYDTANQAVLATLGTANVVANDFTLIPLSDIQMTADGVLVGTSKSKTHYDLDYAGQDGLSERGQVYIYQWTNDETTGLPAGEANLWFTSLGSANQFMANTGESFFYDGTTKEGRMLLTSSNRYNDVHGSGGTDRLWYQMISVVENQKAGESNQRPNSTGNFTVTGNDFQISLSPIDETTFILSGNNADNAVMNYNVLCDTEGFDNVLSFLTPGLVTTGQVNRAGFFKYAGKSYMVAADTQEGKNVGIKLIDITEGLDKAKLVKTLNTTLEASDLVNATAAGVTIADINELGELKDYCFNLVLTRGNKITKFTSKPKDPVTVSPVSGGTANPYAYGLKGEVVENTLKVNYSLNAAATNVKVVVLNEAGEQVAVAEQGAQEAGAYSAEINTAEFAGGKYTWEVEVEGSVKENVEVFFAESLWHPRGLDVDNNFESPAFGTIYVLEGMLNVPASGYYSSGTGAGLYVFNPDLTPVLSPDGDKVFTGGLSLTADPTYYADPSRIRVAEDGRIFITRSNSAGDYITYVKDHADLVANDKWNTLLTGHTFDAAAYTYADAEGNFIAAANVGFDVKGAGENLQIAALSADNRVFGFNTNGARVDTYNLGNADVLPVPTQNVGLSYWMIAPQVSNVAFDPNSNGMWFTQYRSAPKDTQPALVYTNAAGEMTLFEGEGSPARGGGGIRFSPDGSQVAIASSGSQFTIYDLLYDEAGNPTLIANTVVNHGIGTNCYDIAWDLAGNIYICGNSGEWIKGLAMPRTEAAVTKAASVYAFEVEARATLAVEGTMPANGETISNADAMAGLIVMFNEELSWDLAEGASATLVDEQGTNYNVVMQPYGTMLYLQPEIYLEGGMLPAGAYTLTVAPNSVVSAAGELYASEIVMNFNIRGTAETIITPAAGEVVQSLSEITLTNEDCIYYYNDWFGTGIAVLYYLEYADDPTTEANEEVTSVVEENLVPVDDKDDYSMVIRLKETQTKSGTYRLYLPAGYFALTDMCITSEELTHEIIVNKPSVSGVEGVAVDNAAAVYYNLQGVKVEVENLVPGVYVKVQGNKTEKVVIE